jgi:hypothetical protein
MRQAHCPACCPQVRTSWRDHPANKTAVAKLTPECQDLLDKMFEVKQDQRCASWAGALPGCNPVVMQMLHGRRRCQQGRSRRWHARRRCTVVGPAQVCVLGPRASFCAWERP